MREQNSHAVKKAKRMLLLVGLGVPLGFLLFTLFLSDLDMVLRILFGALAAIIATYGGLYLWVLWLRRLRVARGGPDRSFSMTVYMPLIKFFGLPER